MTDNSANNKRIAKNTLLLYFRMLFTMAVSLYTSRVVLNTLGIEDFGINNVVGGVIAMLGFLTNSLSGTSSRFITFSLGKGDKDLIRKTFGNIITIHLIFAGIILVLGETIGLWFVSTQLQIPADREVAAFWVYQFSILSAIMSIISVPYNATIIAHEKMSAFAYISIMDTILKLVIVYLLVIIPYDKLIIYALLFFLIQCFDRIIFSIYCRRHFEETKTKMTFNKNLFKEIFSFTGWAMNGNLAVIGYTQGLNLLLNIFFGPTVNAARGIAVQVQNVVRNFCVNFQMALNPQLTKSYAQGDLIHMHNLLKVSTKFSFFLILFISMPIMLEAKLFLHWWLSTVPEYTVGFLRWILCSSLLATFANPILVSVHATGNIKKFQLIEGTMLLMIVPIAYICLKLFNTPPESVFIIHLLVEACTQCVRLKIVLPMINLKIKDYVYEVLYPIIKVAFFSSVISLTVFLYLPESLGAFFVTCFICVTSVVISVFFIGCTTNERRFILEKITNSYSKLRGKNV